MPAGLFGTRALLLLAVIVLAGGVWWSRPFVRLGWVAPPPPRDLGILGASFVDLQVPLPLPGGTGTAPVTLRLRYSKLQLKPESAPLVLYAPVWGRTRDDNESLLDRLASRGYIIAAMDDFANDPAALDASADDTRIRLTQLEVDTEAGRQQTLAVFDRRVALQAAKVSALLDALDRGVPGWPAAVRYDRARIGMIGASFGGATAVEAAQRDPLQRIRAVVNLDGWLHGEAAARTIRVPFAEFNSTRGVPGPEEIASANPIRRFFAGISVREQVIVQRQLAARPDSVQITIAGAAHGDFFDGLYNPARWKEWRPWRASLIAPARMREIVDTYVLAFFEMHLRGKPDDWFDRSPPPFADAVVKRGR